MNKNHAVKSILSSVLAGALVTAGLPMIVTSAAATGEMGGNWTVSGSNYSCANRCGWPDFSTYLLGNQSKETVTLSADIPVGKASSEATVNGGDSGFVFAVTDSNGNGMLNENGDRYYLVDVSSDNNGITVGVERNDGGWSGFAVSSQRMLYREHDILNLSATYSNGHITVRVDGIEVIDYTDPMPFTGTGYGLVSKITGETFSNVTVSESDVAVTPTTGKMVLTEETHQAIVVNKGDTLTLDLVGHRLNASVTNYGTLHVTDSVGGGIIEVSSNASATVAGIYNYGVCTFENASIFVNGSGSATAVGIYNGKGGSLTVKSGTIRSISKENFGFAIQNLGTIEEISGGVFSSENIHVDNTANLATITNDGGEIKLISGGEFVARRFGKTHGNDRVIALRNRSGGKVGTISGGNFTAEGLGQSAAGGGVSIAYALWNIDNSTIGRITGGTFTGYTEAQDFAFAIRNEATIGEISDGVFRAIIRHNVNAPNAIALANYGTVSVSGGVFYAYNTAPGYTAALRTNSGTATISGGAFYGNKPTNGAIFNAGGACNYASGYSLTDAQPSGYYYVTKTGSTVTESYNEALGSFVGTTDSKSYPLTGLGADAAAIGGQLYPTLADAITAAADGDTIRLTATCSSAVTIPSGKNITLDLNGEIILGKVVNNGTLTVVDSKGFGSIQLSSDANERSSALTNNGTLTVESGVIRCVGLSNNTEAVAIENKSGGHLTVKGGKIVSLTIGTKFGFGIRNAGTIDEISGGIIESMILNKSNGSNCAAITQDAGGVIRLISGGELVARNAGNGTNGSYAAALRLQGGSSATEISGGVFRAIGQGSKGNIGIGIYVDSGKIGKISGGFIGGYTTGTQWGHGLRIDDDSSVETISGGIICGTKTNNDSSCNVLAVNLYGKLNSITGGTFIATSNNCNTIALRAQGSKAVLGSVSGGRFYSNGSGDIGGRILRKESGGTIGYADGYSIGGADENGYCTLKPLSDTVYFFLGSSVTYGSATNGISFTDMIDRDDNGISSIKSAISGTTLVNNGTSSYVARLQSDFENRGTPDKLIVQLSTNDASQKKPLGTLSDSFNKDDFDQTTVIGAIEFIIAYAKDRWNCDVAFYTNCYYQSAEYEDMVRALYKVHSKWGIEIIDFYHTIGVDAPQALQTMMNDSIHPNLYGYRYMADEMMKVLSQPHNQGHIEENHVCHFCSYESKSFVPGYTIGSELTSTYHSAYVQNRVNESTFDLRFIIVSDENEVKDGFVYTLEFKLAGGENRTVTRTIGVDMPVYQAAMAAGKEFYAAEGCKLYGVVITDIPQNGFESCTLTLSDSEGNVISTSSGNYDKLAPDFQ